MMPIPSIESPPGHADLEANRQKAKNLPCRYCQKRFRRLEHVQRHERTHTKEKPFQCSCGKTFGRRDLLVRHEKLVHLNESNKDGHHSSLSKANNIAMTAQMTAPPPMSLPNLIDPDLLATQTTPNYQTQMNHLSPSDSMMQHRTPGCSLDLLSDAANHLASGNHSHTSTHHLPPIMPQMQPESRSAMELDGHHENMGYSGRMQQDPNMRSTGYQQVGQPGLLEDYNLFLDDFGLSSHFFPVFGNELPVSSWLKPPTMEHHAGSDHQRPSNHDGQDDSSSFSRFGSRLPSLQPDFQGSPDPRSKFSDDGPRSGPPWKISSQDHRIIQTKIDDFSSVLPRNFLLPSRHTLSRFLEGYINGFHEHLPFLHIATISGVNCAPELLLALAAVGAQYRFESHRGNGLWYAARAIALEQVRRRNSQQVLEILSPPSTYRSDSVGPSPQSAARHIDSQIAGDLRNFSRNEGDTDGTHSDQCVNTPQARLETIQSLLVLMAMGTWGARALLLEALSLQSQISLLVREEGLTNVDTSHEDLTWEEWIQIEGEKRTKFIVYCFFNLHCIAYDMPPLLLSSELGLTLPHSAKEWKAENAWQWREVRRMSPPADLYFQDVLARLFMRPMANDNYPPTSSLGNYILITALVQQIFFTRQTSTLTSPGTVNNSLRSDDIDMLGQALRSWQASWERTPESSLDPSSPNGPVAFNSTALLRLAYIRLHIDLGPCRRLDTRDPSRIAAAFKDFPPLTRSPRIGRAVLQSAHALSIPVKIGIAFVARTQTFSWSIQHSLCNLECAFLLSKWLETIAMSPMDLTSDERNLLAMVRSMLDETEFAVSFEPEDGESHVDERSKIKQLGAAVVRIWAETFKGTHIFEIVKVIGQSLEIYADLLEKANDMYDG